MSTGTPTCLTTSIVLSGPLLLARWAPFPFPFPFPLLCEAVERLEVFRAEVPERPLPRLLDPVRARLPDDPDRDAPVDLPALRAEACEPLPFDRAFDAAAAVRRPDRFVRERSVVVAI